MNCLEAQSKIVAFIEDKLDDSEVLEFIRHIRSCENCAEELEIYYTLLVGMKQLDEDQELSTNLKAQMEDKLNAEYKHIQNRRKLTGSSIVLVIAIICTVGFFGYESYQNAKYLQEQEAIKSAQSKTYYYDYFGESLFHAEEETFDLASYMEQQEQKEQSSFYERLHSYLMIQEGASQVEETVIN